ncbi:MAG: GNAT family N-acetyltransferase [Bacteroidia bacterium]
MHLEILAADAIDPPSWDAFVEAAPEGGLFSLYAYLSVLRPDWQAAIVKEGDVWQAVMPFFREKKLGFSRVGQPAFTQYWGPVFASFGERSAYKQYSWKRQVLEAMLPAWEKDHLFSMNCSPAFDYPLPFFEAGYELHTRYTYQVDLSLGQEKNWAAMDTSQRRKIRKANQQPDAIEHAFKAEDLLALYDAQAANGHDILGVAPNARQVIQTLLQLLPQRLNTHLRAFRQADGQIIAAACFAEFRDHCYYLFGTYDPKRSQGGEIAALIWDVMQTTDCSIFDFEGSMIPSIARFFRRMGGQPKAYLQLRKNALPLPIRWINELRS